MTALRLLLAGSCLAALAVGQTPLFQRLDAPLPQEAAYLAAAGDLDGDGDVDLLAQSVNWVITNDGHARFSVGVAGGPWMASPVIMDVNGDGLRDLVSFQPSTGAQFNLQVAVYLNVTGVVFTGTAGQPVIPANLNVSSLAAGDVDGDGDADVLIGTTIWASSSIVPGPAILWLNNGAGQFTVAPAASLPAASLPCDEILLRDLDNDGDLDAIFSNRNFYNWTGSAVMVLWNTGGVFAPGPALSWTGTLGAGPIDLGDFNGDGFPDLVAAPLNGNFGVFLGSAVGFAAPVISTAAPGSVLQLAAIDVNGDGKDEILASLWQAGLALYGVSVPGAVGPQLQTWPGLTFAGSGAGSRWVRDLDGDQDRDVVVRVGVDSALLMNTGAGGLVVAGGHTPGLAFTWNHEVADLDADGDLDLLGVVNGCCFLSATLGTAINDGVGFFGAGPATTVSFLTSTNYIYYRAWTFDRDGDGDADLYFARTHTSVSGTSDLLYDNAGATFTQFAPVASTGDTACFRAADFDGDGDLDVLLGKRGYTTNGLTGISGPMVYLPNQGSSGMGPPLLLGTNHATYDLDLGDFDGNGTIDAFQSNGPGFDPCVVYLNSSGTFTPIAQPFSGAFTAAGDLNGDGLTDLVVDGQVWFSAGTGGFIAGPVLPSGLLAPPVLADVDLDGDLDLVETPATVMFNAGGGVFGPPQSYLPRAWGVYWDGEVPTSTLADLDRDGDPDLVYGGVVYLNTTRQLARGSIPRPGRPASVDLYGTPGGAWFLFGANGTASFAFPPWGTVLIDPASAQLGASGLFAGPGWAPGTASFGVTVPNNPALVGWTTYWQAVEATQLRFTNRLTITVMGW